MVRVMAARWRAMRHRRGHFRRPACILPWRGAGVRLQHVERRCIDRHRMKPIAACGIMR